VALIERPEGYSESDKAPSDLTGQTMAKTQKPTAADDASDGLDAFLDRAADEIKSVKHLLLALAYQPHHRTRPSGLSKNRRFVNPTPSAGGESFSFACLADSGAACKLDTHEYPVIHDLASLQVKVGMIPVLFRHQERPIGYAEHICMRAYSGDMIATGFLMRDGCVSLGATIQRAAMKESEGLPGRIDWGISVGTKPIIEGRRGLQYLSHGARAMVNWRSVVGPLFIARGARLLELSVIPWSEASDKGSYLLTESTWEFNQFVPALPGRQEITEARLHREKERAAHQEAVAVGKARGEEIRAQLRRWQQEDLAKELTTRLEERQEREVNQGRLLLGSRICR
jgi:hypothetical protein